ncbi:MAG: hypothetical protein HOB49_28470 [Gemmatimonadetes bacterium]|nr:hypothetical protein [Gemmatimonadota bacterium]
MRRTLTLCVMMLALTAGLAQAAKGGNQLNKKPSAEPGTQAHVARWTRSAPTVDGELSPGEYSAAVPLHLTFNQRDRSSGILPGEQMADSKPIDLSYRVLITYDEDNLYIAFDVTDDVLIDDSDVERPWHDDVAEVFIDGDDVGNDYQLCSSCYNREGFQLLTDIGGDTLTQSAESIDWGTAVGFTNKGYVVEFRVALSSIDTQDGPGTSVPGPGSTIGFNVTVGDDDNGGVPYNDSGTDFVDPTDSYGAWDGDADGWSHRREDDWGSLYFAPTNGRGKIAGSALPHATWGGLKLETQGIR